MRPKTSIDVIVYRPLKVQTNEMGWVAGSYPLALLAIGDQSYLVDPFGIGTNSLNDNGLYNQPVHSINPEDDITPNFRDPIVGCFPVNKETINCLKMDTSMDLADFIQESKIMDSRLDRWVTFYREAKNNAR